MRVLFDQATPVPLRAFLSGHTISTAAQQRWAALENGARLRAAEAEGFDVLVTTDKNMRYQQNLAGSRIAIVVLGYAQWGPRLEQHANRVAAAINAAEPGTYTNVDIPE